MKTGFFGSRAFGWGANLFFLAGCCLWGYYTRLWGGMDESDFRAHYPRFYKLLYWIFVNGIFLVLAGVAVLLPANYLWLKRRNKKYGQNYLLLLFSCFIGLAVMEAGLRLMGFRPGLVGSSRWFHEVERLQMMDGFYTDSLGIMKISPAAASGIAADIQAGKKADHDEMVRNNKVYEVYSLVNDYIEMPDNHFRRYLYRLREKKEKTDMDSAVLWYARHPVNEEGFRSIPFKKYGGGGKRVLLIGDSFTWGHSTKNKTNSFADELLAKGYTVYNAGITGTDPAQYLAVARHYVPLLQPDVVVVNFFMGNDVAYNNRQVIPYRPVFYATNAGNLMACPEGVYFKDAQSAYDHQLRMRFIPPGSWPDRLCALTAVGTGFWKVGKKMGWIAGTDIRNRDYDLAVKQARTEYPYSNVQIAGIEKICAENGARFCLSVFPDIDALGRWVVPADVPGLFADIPYHMKTFRKEEYDLDNNHLNDLGSLNYSLFLDSLLKDGTKK